MPKCGPGRHALHDSRQGLGNRDGLALNVTVVVARAIVKAQRQQRTGLDLRGLESCIEGGGFGEGQQSHRFLLRGVSLH